MRLRKVSHPWIDIQGIKLRTISGDYDSYGAVKIEYTKKTQAQGHHSFTKPSRANGTLFPSSPPWQNTPLREDEWKFRKRRANDMSCHLSRTNRFPYEWQPWYILDTLTREKRLYSGKSWWEGRADAHPPRIIGKHVIYRTRVPIHLEIDRINPFRCHALQMLLFSNALTCKRKWHFSAGFWWPGL